MAYTVKQLAVMSGVSVRTLTHGFFKPVKRSRLVSKSEIDQSDGPWAYIPLARLDQ